ncbi:MAG: phytanoyl-CoA dioxygenase family protein [Acidovorax sp.]|nr:phytanoyl-CoA dioxygenase family protein [Acidovorax sp.]
MPSLTPHRDEPHTPTAWTTPEREALDTQGFVLLPDVLAPAECQNLAALANAENPATATHPPTRGASSGGTRCLLAQAWCTTLAQRLLRHPVLSSLLPAQAVAVQCTYFEKTAARNWLVPLHQDLSIPVAARVSNPGLRGWTDKEGGLFVQPPADTLALLVAVRLHLDPCQADDGPLRVVPGTHRSGVLAPGHARALRDAQGEVFCLASAGTALVMHPLLLHASSKSTGGGRRRVLHFVFGPPVLPGGLRWAQMASTPEVST